MLNAIQPSAPGKTKAKSTLTPSNVCAPVQIDADLRAVVECWPTLPKAIRAGILAMVKAAK